MAFRDTVQALEARVTELEELRETARYIEMPQVQSDSLYAVKVDEIVQEGEHQAGEKGNNLHNSEPLSG